MYHSYVNMSNFSLEAWCLFLCKGSWILLILWTSEVLPSGRALKSEFEHVVWMWTPPSYIHLGSTWRHSCSKCSQAFFIFHHSFTAVYYTEHKLNNNKHGRSGNEAKVDCNGPSSTAGVWNQNKRSWNKYSNEQLHAGPLTIKITGKNS